MTLSPKAFFGNLDELNPKGNDSRTISDDQHRNIIASCKEQGPNWTGEITSTHTDLNLLSGMVANNVKPLPGVAGQSVYFLWNNTAPPGTSIEAPDTNVRELVIGPAGSGGSTGGFDNPNSMSVNISVSVSGTTGSTNTPHTHGTGTISVVPTTLGDADNAQIGSGAGNIAKNSHGHTLSGPTADSGTQTAHSHSFSGGGSGGDTLQPRYARGILVKVDA